MFMELRSVGKEYGTPEEVARSAPMVQVVPFMA